MKCASQNEKTKAKKLTGTSVSFAKHQCDSPRGCEEPDEETINLALSAIRKEANSPQLELVRVTGINPAGNMYFCSTGNDCWGYNTKDKSVTKTLEKTETEVTPTASSSAMMKLN